MFWEKEQLSEVLCSPDYTEGEKLFAKFLFKRNGSFYTSLFEAIQNADPINLVRLEKGFPSEVAAFKKWQREELFNFD